MEEELETTKTEVLDKIQALKWADQEKKQMKETISEEGEEIKHLELSNAAAKAKYDDQLALVQQNESVKHDDLFIESNSLKLEMDKTLKAMDK